MAPAVSLTAQPIGDIMAKSEAPAAQATEEAKPTASVAAATPTAAPAKQEAKPTTRTYHVTNSDGLNVTIEAGSIDAAKYGVMRANKICDRGGMTWTITPV
jgi:cytoskeletal protein RodZ